MKKKSNKPENLIAENRKARFNFELSTVYSAGVVLLGWEVKSLRNKRCNIQDSYVIIKHGEAWIVGMNILLLPTTSTQSFAEPTRTRKLLLNKKEISQLIGMVERKGLSIVATKIYWKKNRAKIEIALARGKKTHDKRIAIKEREWKKEQSQLLKKSFK